MPTHNQDRCQFAHKRSIVWFSKVILDNLITIQNAWCQKNALLLVYCNSIGRYIMAFISTLVFLKRPAFKQTGFGFYTFKV